MSIKLVGHEYIAKTRQYLDYLEDHFNNIEKAFNLVCEKFKDNYLIYDDYHYWNIRGDVINHDLSKFSQHEFTQYRAKFFPTDHEISNRPSFVEGVEPVYQSDIDFDQAWKHHELNNSHHPKGMKKIGNQGQIHGHSYDIVHMAIDLIAMSFKFKDNPHHYYLKNMDKLALEPWQHDLIVDVFEKCGFRKD